VILVNTEKYQTVKYDGRLALSLDFVCKNLDVTSEDFVSLALANLLDEELDWMEHNSIHADSEELNGHKETVKIVKFEANGWVINMK
jgi:hypothetical protein